MITIRQVNAYDKSDWIVLWKQYLDFYNQNISDEVTDQTWQRLLEPGNHECLLAIGSQSQQVIGFITYLFHPSTWTANGYCYIEDLFVDPFSRGQGAGSVLIESVVEIAKSANISRIYWHTDEANQTAQSLYDKVASRSTMIQYRITPSSEPLGISVQ